MGGVAHLGASPDARERDDVGDDEGALGDDLHVAHSGAPGQALGHRPDHVAALEGRTRCREPLGPDEAAEQALDLGAARGRPALGPEQVVERAAPGPAHLQSESGGPGEPALPEPGPRHRREILGRPGDECGRLGRPGAALAGGGHERFDLDATGREGTQHSLGHPLELGHAAGGQPEAHAERLPQPGAQGRLVHEAGRAGVDVDQAGVGGRPGAVVSHGDVGDQDVGVELGVAGARGAVHEGGADEPLRPDAAKPPGSPADAQRPALEVVEGLGDRVGVHGADGGRDVAFGEAVEEGDRFGGREGEVEARHPLAWATPPAVRISPWGETPARTARRSLRRHLAAEPEEPGTLAQPVAGGLARPGVVLLTAGGDGAQVVVLGTGHQLGDGEHPGSVEGLTFLVLGRGLADEGQEGDLGHQAAATEADHGELAPGYQLVGEGPGDPEQLAGLGDGVDEAIVRCLWGADGVWSWTPRWAVDVHTNVHRNVHSWNFLKSLWPAP